MNPCRHCLAIGFLLPLVAVIFDAAPLAAQTTRTKEIFFAGDMAAPELANTYLQDHPGEGLEIITFNQAGRDPVQIFHAYSLPARSAQGVCRFMSTEIFPHKSDDGKTSWDSMPERPGARVEMPLAMGALAPAPCPRQSDPAYAALGSGVTDADFLKVSSFWKDVSESPSKFEAASALLPLLISPRAADRFAMFQSALSAGTGGGMLLRAIFRSGGNSFDLAFASNPADPPNYFLSIAGSETGFQMTYFQTRF